MGNTWNVCPLAWSFYFSNKQYKHNVGKPNEWQRFGVLKCLISIIMMQGLNCKQMINKQKNMINIPKKHAHSAAHCVTPFFHLTQICRCSPNSIFMGEPHEAPSQRSHVVYDFGPNVFWFLLLPRKGSVLLVPGFLHPPRTRFGASVDGSLLKFFLGLPLLSLGMPCFCWKSPHHVYLQPSSCAEL